MQAEPGIPRQAPAQAGRASPGEAAALITCASGFNYMRLQGSREHPNNWTMKEMFSTVLHRHQCRTWLFSSLSRAPEKKKTKHFIFLLNYAYVHAYTPQNKLLTNLSWYEKVPRSNNLNQPWKNLKLGKTNANHCVQNLSINLKKSTIKEVY